MSTANPFTSGAQNFVSLGALLGAECSHCGRRSVTLCQCPCKKAYYCDVGCQRSHWQTHKEICTKAQRHVAARLNRCASCGSLSNVLKICACGTVYYCSLECQRKHYGVHRRICTVAQNRAGLSGGTMLSMFGDDAPGEETSTRGTQTDESAHELLLAQQEKLKAASQQRSKHLADERRKSAVLDERRKSGFSALSRPGTRAETAMGGNNDLHAEILSGRKSADASVSTHPFANEGISNNSNDNHQNNNSSQQRMSTSSVQVQQQPADRDQSSSLSNDGTSSTNNKNHSSHQNSDGNSLQGVTFVSEDEHHSINNHNNNEDSHNNDNNSRPNADDHQDDQEDDEANYNSNQQSRFSTRKNDSFLNQQQQTSGSRKVRVVDGEKNEDEEHDDDDHHEAPIEPERSRELKKTGSFINGSGATPQKQHED